VLDTGSTAAYSPNPHPSGGGKTVSIIGLFNDQSYAGQLAAFGTGIDLGKVVAESPSLREEPARSSSTDITSMHAAELVSEFETNRGPRQSAVHRKTSAHSWDRKHHRDAGRPEVSAHRVAQPRDAKLPPANDSRSGR
jgi:hypothetical protein